MSDLTRFAVISVISAPFCGDHWNWLAFSACLLVVIYCTASIRRYELEDERVRKQEEPPR